MAKTKGMTKPVAKFCSNCSQPVKGKIAEMAAKIGVVYCCNCRVQLDNSGDCQNPNCPFYQTAPTC